MQQPDTHVHTQHHVTTLLLCVISIPVMTPLCACCFKGNTALITTPLSGACEQIWCIQYVSVSVRLSFSVYHIQCLWGFMEPDWAWEEADLAVRLRLTYSHSWDGVRVCVCVFAGVLARMCVWVCQGKNQLILWFPGLRSCVSCECNV